MGKDKMKDKASIPTGWIRNASKSHPDRVYYFNPETGQSVWNLNEISDTKRPVTRSISKENLNQQCNVTTSSKKRPSNEPDKSAKCLKVGKPDSVKIKSPKTPKANSTSKKNVSSSPCRAIGKKKALEQLKTSIKSIQGKLARKADSSVQKASKNQLENKNIGKARIQTDVIKSHSVNKVPISKKQIEGKKEPPVKNPPKKLSQVKKPVVVKQSSKKTVNNLQKEVQTVKKDLVSDIINNSNIGIHNNSGKKFRISKKKEVKESSSVVTAKIQAESNAEVNNSFNRQDSSTNGITKSSPVEAFKDEIIPMFVDDMDWEEGTAPATLCLSASNPLDVTASDDIVLPADVDMFEFEDYHEQADGITDCIRVVDTNIYIDDLKLVESVVNKEILAVPWTVIQELDGLKNNNASNVSGSAREAGRWLSLQVKAKRPGIIFQKMSDVATVAGAEETADDKILLYCLYLKDLYGENVSIVTNDTNLATKALIEEVEAFTAKNLTEEYKSKQDLPKSLTTTSDLNTNRNQAKISATSHLDNDKCSTRRSTDLNTSNHSSNSSSSSTSTNIQDKVIKEKKSECDIDCDLVLTCLTHIWHILTVITQGLLICAGKKVGELVSPSYPVSVEQAPALYNNVLAFIMQIGKEYEELLSDAYSMNNLQAFCNLLNNFKKSLNIFSHEAWKNTPIINQNQLESFLKKERLKAENGFQQLVSIREELSRCNEGV